MCPAHFKAIISCITAVIPSSSLPNSVRFHIISFSIYIPPLPPSDTDCSFVFILLDLFFVLSALSFASHQCYSLRLCRPMYNICGVVRNESLLIKSCRSRLLSGFHNRPGFQLLPLFPVRGTFLGAFRAIKIIHKRSLIETRQLQIASSMTLHAS